MANSTLLGDGFCFVSYYIMVCLYRQKDIKGVDKMIDNRITEVIKYMNKLFEAGGEGDYGKHDEMIQNLFSVQGDLE